MVQCELFCSVWFSVNCSGLLGSVSTPLNLVEPGYIIRLRYGEVTRSGFNFKYKLSKIYILYRVREIDIYIYIDR